MQETISLYLGLEPGEKADFEVVGRAAAAFAEAVREIAYVLEPGLEIKLEFDSGTEGSLSLNAILKAATSKTAVQASLISISVVVAGTLTKDLRTYGVGKLLDWYVVPEKRQELSENDVQRIAKALKDVVDGKIAKEPVQQVYKELERDTVIKSVGATTTPDTKPSRSKRRA